MLSYVIQTSFSFFDSLDDLSIKHHYPAKRNEHSLNQDVLSEYHDKQLSFAANQYQPYTSQNQDSPHKFVKKFLDHDDAILL